MVSSPKTTVPFALPATAPTLLFPIMTDLSILIFIEPVSVCPKRPWLLAVGLFMYTPLITLPPYEEKSPLKGSDAVPIGTQLFSAVIFEISC